LVKFRTNLFLNFDPGFEAITRGAEKLPARFQFFSGYHEHLHPEPSINFQMNRWVNYLGPDALRDMETISTRLYDIPSYRREFLSLAEKALYQGRDLFAAYYFRSAEFFMRKGDPEKLPTRKKFLDLVCKEFRIGEEARFSIPYQDGDIQGNLPGYIFSSLKPKGTIIIHGGFDSYIEEFFPVILYIREKGFRVFCFEGPGQGGALMDSGLHLTQEWHKPVSAVLDYFKIESTTLIGISMGACLAMRAASLEPRIQRVVAYDVFLDWMDVTLQKLSLIAPVLRLLLSLRATETFNSLLARIMNKNPLFDWSMHQAYMILNVTTPYEVFLKSRLYTTRDISAKIRQDVLLLAGEEDFIIPLDHIHEQKKILSEARSVTSRIFTRAEQAQNHAQVGNLQLAVDFILDWIEEYEPTYQLAS
jgi:pimeloyl-ACP methyl ester carboxylesterase